MKTASFHWDNVDELLLEVIPWLAGHEKEIRPASALVTRELVATGVRTRDDLKQITTEKGPAILAAANDLKNEGHTPRQVVLRALLAAGIPADPARRALIDRVATLVDAIVADFDAWFLSWDNLAADPNAWITEDIDRFLHIKDRGGFGALSSQEWGLEWWPIIFIDGNGGGFFDPAASMQFTFAVKWQRVLGLEEASFYLSGRLEGSNFDWFFSSCIPMLPGARDVFKPDLTSREAWQRTKKQSSEAFEEIFGRMNAYFMSIDPLVEWAGWGRQETCPETLSGVVAVYQKIGPHILEMANDLVEKLDPALWSDERLVAWMRSTNALRDLEKAVEEREDGQLEVPSRLPRRFLNWIVDHEFGEKIDGYLLFKTKLLELEPLSQEIFAVVVTRAFSNEAYPETWWKVARFLQPEPIDEDEMFYWQFWLAWSIEWRSRLGFDIKFSYWDDFVEKMVLDPRLHAFGAPPVS